MAARAECQTQQVANHEITQELHETRLECAQTREQLAESSGQCAELQVISKHLEFLFLTSGPFYFVFVWAMLSISL